MRRYGARDYGYHRDPGPRGYRYDRGYRGGGWGMVGLNESILRGPRPEERAYDRAYHAGEGGGRPGIRAARPRPYPEVRYRGYDRGIGYRGVERYY